MSWSLKVGRLAGMEIYVHFTFFLLLIWFIGNERNQGREWGDVWQATAILLGAFFCVVLHELGHALAARQFGIRTRDIVILPIGGVARLERMPRIAWQELVVAIAGPMVSAGIAVLIGVVFAFQGVPLLSALEGSVGTINHFWANLLFLNGFLVVFNLIPAFPMDGGRVFRSLLSMGLGRLKATKVASCVGQVIALLFILYGVANTEWILAFIGGFIFLAARAEGKETIQESLLAGYRIEQAMFYQYPVLSASTPVTKIIALFLNAEPAAYAVVREDGTFIGFLDDDDLCAAIRSRRIDNCVVADICVHCSEYVTKTMPVAEGLTMLRTAGFAALPVLENGKMLGVFSVSNVNRLMSAVDSCRRIDARLNLDKVRRPDVPCDIPPNASQSPLSPEQISTTTPESVERIPQTDLAEPIIDAILINPVFAPDFAGENAIAEKPESERDPEFPVTSMNTRIAGSLSSGKRLVSGWLSRRIQAKKTAKRTGWNKCRR